MVRSSDVILILVSRLESVAGSLQLNDMPFTSLGCHPVPSSRSSDDYWLQL